MSVNLPNHQVAVDRREETGVTEQPVYAATEQVTRLLKCHKMGHS